MEQVKTNDGSFALIKKSYLILTVVSFFVVTGIGIGVSQTQLAAKLDESQARKVVKEEIQSEMKHYYTDTDGQVLKIEVENLQKQIDRLEKIIEKIK